MTNPPEIPKDIIESYKKLSEAKQKRLEFMAAYPEYLLDKNREDLLNGIDPVSYTHLTLPTILLV